MMADALTSTQRSNGDASPNPEAVLNALAAPVLVIGEGNGILYVNAAAEQFLSASSAALRDVSVSKIFREDSPVLALLSAVRINGHPVTEYGIAVETPRINARSKPAPLSRRRVRSCCHFARTPWRASWTIS